MMRDGQAKEPAPLAGPPRLNRVRFLPNIRVDDGDMCALFAYLDEKYFEGSTMVLMPGYVRFLLERHTPMLPPWLVEGIVAVYDQAGFLGNPITVGPASWIGREGRAFERDPETPRALLPMAELFSPAVLHGEDRNAT